MGDLQLENQIRETIPRVVYVREPEGGSDSSDAEISSSEEEEARFLITEGGPNVPAEYWQIQKLIKYIKAGDQTATNISLSILKDHDLTLEMNQIAIKDVGGLEVLVNILETEEHRCRCGSLAVINDISLNPIIRRDFANLGVIPLLVEIVGGQARDLQILAAESIAKIGKVRMARRHVRKCDGIRKLTELLIISDRALNTPVEGLNDDKLEEVAVARAAAKAFWTLTASKKNVVHIMKSGCITHLAKAVKSVHTDLVLPVIGTLQQCAKELTKYKISLQTEGIIVDFVRYLTHKELEIVKYSAIGVCNCSDDKATRDQVRAEGGLDPLVKIAKDKAMREDKSLMAAVLGAIWKCSLSPENCARFDELRTVDVLVSLLDEDDNEIQTNATGCLTELCKNDENCNALRMAKGLPLLVGMLSLTWQPMLANVAITLGLCALNKQCMLEIEELDGVRLIWSLLKNPDHNVQARAAAALVPCVKNAFDSGEMVRSFVGALELIVSRLRSPSIQVLSSVCAAIAQIAQDKENLAVITDHGVVKLLSSHVHTENEDLRKNLARAIAYCCAWGKNCHEFGRQGAIRAVCLFMSASDDKEVHKNATIAIHMLSEDPFNCIELHSSGVVESLLRMIRSDDIEVQLAAAAALRNMRKLALAAEKFKFDR